MRVSERGRGVSAKKIAESFELEHAGGIVNEVGRH